MLYYCFVTVNQSHVAFSILLACNSYAAVWIPKFCNQLSSAVCCWGYSLKPRLHDTTGLTIVLKEQQFVQPVVKPGCTTGLTNTVWQPVECLYIRYSRLSNRLSNGFDNRLDNRIERTAVRSTGCQTGLYNRFDNGFDNRLYCVYKHFPGCQTDWQPVWQQVVSRKWGLREMKMKVLHCSRVELCCCPMFTALLKDKVTTSIMCLIAASICWDSKTSH